MHEEGDPPDESSTTGRLFHSGIRRVDDIDPADYALPPGVPALQDEELEEDLPSETPSFRTSRRDLLAFGLGIAVVSTGTGIISWWQSPTKAAPPEPAGPAAGRDSPPKLDPDARWLIEGARTAARGPLRDLVKTHGTFIMVVEEYGASDPVLWEGIERLSRFALADREAEGIQIARRVLGALPRIAPSGRTTILRLELEDLIWRWERRR